MMANYEIGQFIAVMQRLIEKITNFLQTKEPRENMGYIFVCYL